MNAVERPAIAPWAKYLSPKDTKANIPYPIAKGIATAAETNPPMTSSRTFKAQGCGIDNLIAQCRAERFKT